MLLAFEVRALLVPNTPTPVVESPHTPTGTGVAVRSTGCWLVVAGSNPTTLAIPSSLQRLGQVISYDCAVVHYGYERVRHGSPVEDAHLPGGVLRRRQRMHP